MTAPIPRIAPPGDAYLVLRLTKGRYHCALFSSFKLCPSEIAWRLTKNEERQSVIVTLLALW